MRRLSAESYRLLGQIQTSPTLWQRLSADWRPTSQALARLAGSGDYAAVPYLLPYLRHPHRDAALAASEAIHRLLAATPDEDLPWLDQEIRHLGNWRGDAWSRLQPKEVSTIASAADYQTSMLGVLSSHPNGLVREAAIRQIAGSGERAGLRFLLVRMNDWVKPIRTLAGEVVQSWLVEGPLNPFLAHSYLVLRLEDCGRCEEAPIARQLLERLLQSGGEHVLLELVRHGDPRVRRRWFASAIEIPGSHLPHLVRAGLESDDVVIQSRAARKVRLALHGEALRDALSVMLRARFVAVRQQALLVLVKDFPETAPQRLQEALLDRSASLRELARFYLRRMAPLDAVEFYRQALLKRSQVPVALRGLGETGTERDVPELVRHLSSTSPAERKAAAEGIAKLAGDEYAETMWGLLVDDQPGVVKNAQKWLSGKMHLVELRRVHDVLLKDGRLHVRLAVLALLDQAESWEGLPYLLQAAAGSDIVAEKARSSIAKRYNRLFTRPSREQLERIHKALAESAEELESKFLREFNGWLHGLGLAEL